MKNNKSRLSILMSYFWWLQSLTLIGNISAVFVGCIRWYNQSYSVWATVHWRWLTGVDNNIIIRFKCSNLLQYCVYNSRSPIVQAIIAESSSFYYWWFIISSTYNIWVGMYVMLQWFWNIIQNAKLILGSLVIDIIEIFLQHLPMTITSFPIAKPTTPIQNKVNFTKRKYLTIHCTVREILLPRSTK